MLQGSGNSTGLSEPFSLIYIDYMSFFGIFGNNKSNILYELHSNTKGSYP